MWYRVLMCAARAVLTRRVLRRVDTSSCCLCTYGLAVGGLVLPVYLRSRGDDAVCGLYSRPIACSVRVRASARASDCGVGGGVVGGDDVVDDVDDGGE